jgi:serine/threonine-protein kinase
MDPDLWRRVEEIFHAALERQGAERRRFLAEACRGEPALQAEVEELLAAGSRSPEGWIEEAIRGAFALAGGEAPGEELPARIGPYRVLRLLGRGGLADVWLTERIEEGVRVEVAVKVVRRGLDTRDILARLRRERWILARLDHPHIARLLDGGSTETGAPYFVLEAIDGEPIDRYCESRELGVTERLELFCSVCAAVHHAHRNLVLHRDLKPSNVLVTPEGVPKLLDFGIAKLLDPEHPEEAPPTRTAAGLRLFTPAYASPEQVRGLPLTTATDVYSLGVLLYRLLTGRSPYEVTGRHPEEVERAVWEADPPKPSATVTNPRRRRRLAGDLDTIVSKALRKEPERRYASAEQLSEDLRRHIAGLPVRARPDTAAYRLSTFVRRHRRALAVSAAGAVLTASLVGYHTVRLTAERNRARVEAASKARVLELVVSLFEESDPRNSQGRDLTAREILERGAERIRAGLGDEPEARATLLDVLGRVHQSLGLYETAEEQLREALELRRQALGEAHPEVAASLNNLGDLLYERGQTAEAETLVREALDIRRAAFGPEHETVAESLNDLAALALGRGDAETAETLLGQALALRRRLFGEDHPKTASSLRNLAAVLHQGKRDFAAAEPLYRQALAIQRRHLGGADPQVAVTLVNLARLLDETGDGAAAEPLYRDALSIQRRALGDEHPDVLWTMNNLGVLLARRGRTDEAERLYRQALATVPEGGGDPRIPTALRGNLAALAEGSENESTATATDQGPEAPRGTRATTAEPPPRPPP